MPNPKSFYIQTYGCQMNDADSDFMADHLLDSGLIAADSADKAGLIIVNTCSVRENAEHKAMSYMGRIAPLKNRNKNLKIIFAGCMAQRTGEHIKKRFPQIDLVVGAKDIEHFPRLVDSLLNKGSAGKGKVASSRRKEISKVSELVTIMRGCENFCSYCVVPYVRGKELSRPAGEILSEVKKLAKDGAREITLVGQNVNSYRDSSGFGVRRSAKKQGRKAYDFADLLAEVSEIKGIERVRFMTSHPKDLGGRLMNAIAGLGKVCEHLHLPLQSGSDRILKLMNRGYTFGEYLDVVRKLKKKEPEISFTTDILVGFPGETDKDFAETLSAIKAADFDNLYAFKYSPRPGTAAEKLVDDVPREAKEERLNEVLKAAAKISSKKNAKLLNKVFEVLVEAKQGEYLEGRTRANKKIFFKGPARLVGKMAKVKIIEVKVNTLKGELVSP